jgi:BON domain
MLYGLKRISTALGLMAATAGVTQAQAPSNNQATAEAVASTLRSSANLSPYRIEIETRDGVATLTGTVETLDQKAEAIGRAQAVPGITGVIDRINVGRDSRVQPAQYQVAMGSHRMAGGPMGGGDIIYGPGDGPNPLAPGMYGPGGGVGGGGVPLGPGMAGPGMGGPAMGGAMMDGPMPEGPAGAPGATAAPMPGSPNYAWPSYAPYPNFSAVGYPTAYPWQAWPNIGPFYPYPEVPLDWRAVTLRWDDGIWWLDFKKNYTRPFFTPYPFGIFAY